MTTTYRYDAFGRSTTEGTASTNPVQYTGRENDGTGLQYSRARYYHPGLQRFISEDPIGFGGGTNLYAYVFNSPAGFRDPLGLFRMCEVFEDFTCGGGSPPPPPTDCPDSSPPGSPGCGRGGPRASAPAPSGVPGSYYIPPQVQVALEGIFGPGSTAKIQVIYSPLYVDLHMILLGGGLGATTRPERIYTNMSAEEFFANANAFLVLHEFYHVIEQWGKGMTRLGYLLNNGTKEKEANDFASKNLGQYQQLLGTPP